MAIFHSYVSLPEGNRKVQGLSPVRDRSTRSPPRKFSIERSALSGESERMGKSNGLG